MNHITQEQSEELALKCRCICTGWRTLEMDADALNDLCNAAIEWHIAQQAASVDATFKKWNTPILDKYAPKQIGNVDSVCTSQERVCETAKSEQVPLRQAQIIAMYDVACDVYVTQDARAIEFARAIEKYHGIGGKV